jgi:plastocyanin
MTARRAWLATLAATALLVPAAEASTADSTPRTVAKEQAVAPAPEAGPAGSTSRTVAKERAPAAHAPTRAKANATARKRARLRARTLRWRVASSALRIGPGTLFGGSTSGGSTTAPGGAPGDPPSGGGSDPAQPPPVYHTLSVASREFSLTLSRQLLTPGTETIQLNNRGEDPHNLVIAAEDGSGDPIATYPDVASLETHTEQVELPAGRYKLWCSLPGHEALGMRATVRVE